MRQDAAVIDQALREFFVIHGIPPCRILVAVSGGADSTALLLGLAAMRSDGFDIVAAHVNHHLRGADSDADERFVHALCERLDIELDVADGSLDPATIRHRGIEAAARQVRYRLLQDLRIAREAAFIATAHQRNDQAETVLMRLLSRAGIASLRGIHPVRADGVIRPLLDVDRTAIEDDLRRRGIVSRHDRTNDDPRFLRNRARAMLRGGHGVRELADVAAAMQRFWPFVERAVDAADRGCAVTSSSETRFLHLPDDHWLRGALLQRHIHRLDPDARDFDVARIAASLDSLERMTVTKTLELVRVGQEVVLRAPPVPVERFELEVTAPGELRIDALGSTMHVMPVPVERRPPRPPIEHGQGGGHSTGEHSPQLIRLPSGAEPRFTVRNRRPGDRFQPLGMAQPKKLKDFLIDRKIAADVRDRLPLLIWNGEIVWIAGVEVSERFRVSAAEGDLYRVWLEGPGAADERDHAGLRR